MSRIAHVVLLTTVSLCAGCAHFFESRAINRFTKALEKKDFDALKISATDSFEQKALRSAESLDDFQLVNLPKGKTSVVKVEDVSETEKRVFVEVGEKKRKLLYKLNRDAESGKWVVDDIYMKRKKKGLTVTKSVSEQMDLLLTVREFLDAWREGERNDVLAVTAPEFGQLLGELPATYLARLTRRVIGARSKNSNLRPVAQLDEDVAIVKIPRSSGKMMVAFKLLESGWKITDISIESRQTDQSIRSVAKNAAAMRTAIEFLNGYRAADRAALAAVCTRKFFTGSLAHVDLSSVKLLHPEEGRGDYGINVTPYGADFVIRGEAEYVKIALSLQDNTEVLGKTPQFLVEEVTIFELDSNQNKRLSSLFTAQAVMKIFSQALMQRDRAMLRNTSTANFNRRVWDHVDDQMIRTMPLREFDRTTPEVVSTVFHGALTEITVTQGARALTYILKDREGDVRVDDVILPVTNRPGSLKTTLEIMLPIYHFSQAVRDSNIGSIQRTSSNDFNRLAWRQIETLPAVVRAALRHLQAPLTRIERGDDTVLVILGDDRWGARVLLVKDHEFFVIDEIQMIEGPQPEQRTYLKKAIREMMADGKLTTTSVSPPKRLQPVQAAPMGDVNTPLQNPALPVVESSNAAFATPLRRFESMSGRSDQSR